MHHQFDVIKNGEKYYYSLLILYKPWSVESDILGPSSTYQEEFFRVLDEIPAMKIKYTRMASMKKARMEMDEKVDRETDGVSQDDSEDGDTFQFDDEDIAKALRDFEELNKKSSIRTQEDLDNRVNLLNVDQRRVFDRITHQLVHIMDHNDNKCTKSNCKGVEPLYLYCSGPGGTGKSFLLESIVGFMYVQTHVHNRPCDGVLAAPSGLAADNIKGATIHSAFSLPVEHGTYSKHRGLHKRMIDQMRAVMKNTKCVILDEISMVSNAMLLLIHLRLGEIFNPNELFGGLKCVIFFGDLLQLPPVNAKPPYDSMPAEQVAAMTGGTRVEYMA